MSEKENTKPKGKNAQSDETEQLYIAEVERVQEAMKARVEAIRRSRRLSDRDFQIVINARG